MTVIDIDRGLREGQYRIPGTEHEQEAPPREMHGPAGVTADQLKQFVERIERLEEEKQTIADDIKDVFSEAKSTGYDTKILKMVIRIRKMDKAEREEQEALLDLYLNALGMISTGGDDR